MTIKELQPNEWKLYKQIRLEALKESPDSFGQVYDDVVNEPDAYWQEKTNALAEKKTIFMALDNERAVGMIYAFLRDNGDAGLGGMYVSPESRRQGLARALIDHALAWVKERCITRVTFYNRKGNLPAQQLYESYGFTLTGKEMPIEWDDTVLIEQMEMKLS